MEVINDKGQVLGDVLHRHSNRMHLKESSWPTLEILITSTLRGRCSLSVLTVALFFLQRCYGHNALMPPRSQALS